MIGMMSLSLFQWKKNKGNALKVDVKARKRDISKGIAGIFDITYSINSLNPRISGYDLTVMKNSRRSDNSLSLSQLQ